MNLIFIRHGDPDYEKDTLTPRGWREASLLAPRVSRWENCHFFCSPMGRAQDTARDPLLQAGRTARTLPWLREFQVPVDDPVTGQPRGVWWDLLPDYWTGVEQYYDKDSWCDAGIMTTGRVRETFDELTAGLDGLLEEFGYRRRGRYYEVVTPNEENLVFFCHMGLTLIALGYLLGIAAPPLLHGFCCPPTGITVVTTEQRQPGKAAFRTRAVGDVAHLTAAGVVPSSSAFFEEVWQDEPSRNRLASWWEPVGKA